MKRECGCEWEIIPVAEQSERVRQVSFGSSVARFIRRCGEHDKMCRSLEPWEINLFGSETASTLPPAPGSAFPVATARDTGRGCE